MSYVIPCAIFDDVEISVSINTDATEFDVQCPKQPKCNAIYSGRCPWATPVKINLRGPVKRNND